ncbi:hypothetical protein M8C13_35645 [Crossiella sp. SN42]|uniref:hypothetical protein n=1 Tax=Crossiella sp. SN42 TaxID=2944808 RepID=UPI00207D169A|nr:hypothetical protein [Crossiella sp. SN42]MCO1581100.1 hypothetical protein [Crossiella sp. SN42]
MAGSTLRLRGPSGRAVTVRLPDAARVTSVAAEVRFAGGVYSRGFQIGPRGYHEFACREVLPATAAHRFPAAGREVLASATADGDTTVVSWLGPFHELLTVFSGPAPSRETLLALFSGLDLDDRPEGLRVRAAVGQVLERITLTVHGRGTVTIPGPETARQVLPKHRGAATPGGELWRLALPGRKGSPDARDYLFVLAGLRGAAEVQLSRDTGASTDELLDWVAGLDVAWAGH